jgi:uncharacterized membrane protein
VVSLLVVRVLHVAAACTSFGGLLYARAVLWPSLRHVPAEARGPLLASVMRRFSFIKWAGVAIVAVTGILQWRAIDPALASSPRYLGSFAVKMAGACGLLVVTALLALPSRALAGMQNRRALWSGLNLAFAATILVGAALMHAAHWPG